MQLAFNTVNRTRMKRRAADAMSKVPTDGTETTKPDDDIPLLTITASMASTVETEHEQERSGELRRTKGKRI